MANYYNVVGWKHTGFDYYNRPFSREVLNGDYFTNQDNYFQMKGITVKREDMDGIKWIDLPGSVKDITGDQVNAPNSTGSHGPGGPWYSLEEVDYIRLTRTGYPGDPDYVDISGNPEDPWNTVHAGKLFIAYYFVTGLQPIARNVTRVFLQLDEWTTMGGASELEIETGFKVRGHITEAEDAAGYNLAPERINLLEPLELKDIGYINDAPAEEGNIDVIASSIDLTQYSEEPQIDAFVAQSGGQSAVFPAISSVSYKTDVQCNIPLEDGSVKTLNYDLVGYGFFDYENTKVQHNLSVLYSTGQLELQDSFSLPKQYIFATSADGRLVDIASREYQEPSPVKKDITGYPRKADYLFGSEVLFSCATGSMNAQPFHELADDAVSVWAIPTPNGSPVARFKKIRNHPYEYDQTVTGMTWVKKAIVMEGASGSFWNQLNNAFAQQTQNRAVAENQFANSVADYRYHGEEAQRTVDAAIAVGRTASSVVSGTNVLSGGKETWDAAQQVSAAVFDEYQAQLNRQAELQSRNFKADSLVQAQNQLTAQIAQQNVQAPYVNFVPDLNSAVFQPNAFGVYVINTSAKDRTRLKNYFRRYGYNGLYKPLTWDEINVKSRVNFIQCEAVCLKHSHYPTRMTAKTSALLSQGIFLWNERPNQSAFADNPDN